MSIPKISNYPIPDIDDIPANRVKWRVDAGRAALLIHDMQRYFLRFYEADSELLQTLVNNIAKLKQWANEHGVPVFYTAQPHDQPAADRALLNDMWGPGLTKADPEQQVIVPEIAPTDKDIVLTKWRYSAFQRSDLDAQMAALKRDQLIVVGVYAHIGCMITAVEAFMKDIQPFMVADAVADFSAADHVMALRYIAGCAGVVTQTHDILMPSGGVPLKTWLMSRVLELMHQEANEDFDMHENLILYGLDSLRIMRIAEELRQRGIEISLEQLGRTPTLSNWIKLVEERDLR